MADENASTEGLANHEAVATPEHQLLMDRFKSLFQGALDYVKNHLPEHDLKSTVVDNIKGAWDNTAAVIKAEADTEFQKLKAQGEEAAQGALAAGEQIATEAAAGVEQAAGSVVESNAGTSNAGNAPAAGTAAATGGAPDGASTSAAESATNQGGTDTPTK